MRSKVTSIGPLHSHNEVINFVLRERRKRQLQEKPPHTAVIATG